MAMWSLRYAAVSSNIARLTPVNNGIRSAVVQPPVVQARHVGALHVGQHELVVLRPQDVGIALVGAARHLARDLVGVGLEVPVDRRIGVRARAALYLIVLLERLIEVQDQLVLVGEDRVSRRLRTSWLDGLLTVDGRQRSRRGRAGRLAHAGRIAVRDERHQLGLERARVLRRRWLGGGPRPRGRRALGGLRGGRGGHRRTRLLVVGLDEEEDADRGKGEHENADERADRDQRPLAATLRLLTGRSPAGRRGRWPRRTARGTGRRRGRRGEPVLLGRRWGRRERCRGGAVRNRRRRGAERRRGRGTRRRRRAERRRRWHPRRRGGTERRRSRRRVRGLGGRRAHRHPRHRGRGAALQDGLGLILVA